jgi:short-subunit dehydrogenase
MGRLNGQVVIITGASAGIGEATARMLTRQGASVVITARRAERLEALKREFNANGRVLTVAGDITSEADRRNLVDQTLSRFGRIDALVNNAGFGQRGPIEIVPVEKIRQNFETNLFSLVALTQLVIPIMREQGRGRIINISSVAGKIARPLSSVYDATKHALEAISDGLRGELAGFGIQVVVIEPGFILTEFFDVANTIARPVIEQESPYSPYVRGFKDGYRRVLPIAGVPDDIAALVVKALVSERPRNRYAAPRHAKFFLAMKRWMPERLFDYFVARQSGMRKR